MTNLKTLALAAVVALWGGSASAVTYEWKSEDFAGNDCAGKFGGKEGTLCIAPDRLDDGYTASPAIAKFDLEPQEGEDPWTFYAAGGNLLESMFTIILNPDNDGRSGSWAYDPTGCATCAAITSFVIKAGNEFRWYYTSPKTAVFSGAWSGMDKGFSHITFYDTELAPIPLPAAGFLMLGALGALGVAARRRKA